MPHRAKQAPKARRAEAKSERLDFRVTPSAKKLIQRASSVSGFSAADLACEGARRLLEEHDRIRLAEADRVAFLRALTNPPKPSARLVAALRRHMAELE